MKPIKPTCDRFNKAHIDFFNCNLVKIFVDHHSHYLRCSNLSLPPPLPPPFVTDQFKPTKCFVSDQLFYCFDMAFGCEKSQADYYGSAKKFPLKPIKPTRALHQLFTICLNLVKAHIVMVKSVFLFLTDLRSEENRLDILFSLST